MSRGLAGPSSPYESMCSVRHNWRLESGSWSERPSRVLLISRISPRVPVSLLPQNLLARMMKLHDETTSFHPRLSCLNVILRLLFAGMSSQLRVQLRDVSVSTFVAHLMTADSSEVISLAMDISTVLMHKLPDIYMTCFMKEGVVQESKSTLFC